MVKTILIKNEIVMKTIFTFIIALFMFVTLPALSQDEGSAAPDFTLEQLSGGNFKLSEQSGKVVLIFWMGWNCSLCRAAAPSVKEDLVDVFQSNDDFVAIAVDTWDGNSSGVSSFQSQTGLNVNYLLNGSSVANNYNTTYDRLAVVDKSGVLVHKGTTAASSDLTKTKDAITEALQVTTSVPELSANLTVFKNYPNPFSHQTTIQFKVENTSLVSIDVYDISGKKIREITNREYSPGNYQLTFSKGNLEKGLYFLRLQNDNFVTARKMVIH